VLEEDHGQYDTVRQVFWVSGAAMFIRLKEYKEVGGLDKDFFAHMEEIDLCWRLNARSKTLVCVPQSVVFHVGGGTLGKENPRKTFLNFRNNLLMLYKNLPEKELKKVLFVRGVLDWIAACVFFLKGERESAKAVLQARREFKDLRASYEEKRSDNMSKTVVGRIFSRVSYSILWKYHVCRKRCYSQLHD
jgi:GT2 family glycosyltransferase